MGDAFSRVWAHEAPSVLVAEDDPDLRRVLVESLVRDGYEVAAVSNGAALVIELTRSAALQRPRVDLLISDVRMPMCSGLAAVEAVRKLAGDVPVVMLSAFADASTHERAQELGAILLDKPVRLSALRGVVAGMLGRRVAFH